MTPASLASLVDHALERLEHNDVLQYNEYIVQARDRYGAEAVRVELEQRKSSVICAQYYNAV